MSTLHNSAPLSASKPYTPEPTLRTISFLPLGSSTATGVDQQNPCRSVFHSTLPEDFSSATSLCVSVPALTMTLSPSRVGLEPEPNTLIPSPSSTFHTVLPCRSNAYRPPRPK